MVFDEGKGLSSEQQQYDAKSIINEVRGHVETGLAFKVLDETVQTASGHVAISTMHLAKGLEFRAVVVMAYDDEVIPLQAPIETVGDDADLQEVYDTERHLLYVACTRARDHLLVTGIDPVSEILDDLKASSDSSWPPVRPSPARRYRRAGP